MDSEIHRPVNNRIYITGPELYKVIARNRSYIKPDLRPIDWARAAVELSIPALLEPVIPSSYLVPARYLAAEILSNHDHIKL